MSAILLEAFRDLTVRGSTYARPANYKAGLLVKQPDNTYAELDAAGYGRLNVPLTTENWYPETPGRISFEGALRFPAAGIFPAGTRVDAVALFAERTSPETYDFVAVIAGGFTVPPSGGYILLPPRSLKLSFQQSPVLTLSE